MGDTERVIDIVPERTLAGRCSLCGIACCNCKGCVESKGRADVCGPCRRAELAKAAKLVA